MNKETLRGIGLTDTEINAYTALLSLGSSPAGKIVEQTGIYRKNLYDALNKLIEKGLVTYVIENKVKYFQPKDPENLIRFLEEKKNRISEKEEKVRKELPLLKQMFGSLSPEIESEIYRGTQGIKTILRECLNHKEILFIGATGDVENRLPYFWPGYNKKREKLRIKWKLLLIHEAKNKSITKSQYYEYKVLPEILSGPNVIYIYGEYVANVLWLEKPVAFVIRHKDLSENYRKYFNYLWKSAK